MEFQYEEYAEKVRTGEIKLLANEHVSIKNTTYSVTIVNETIFLNRV